MNFGKQEAQKKFTHLAIGTFAEAVIAVNGLAILCDEIERSQLLSKINQYFPAGKLHLNYCEHIIDAIAYAMICSIFVNRLWFKLFSIVCFSYHNLLCHNLILLLKTLDLGQAILFLSNIVVILLAISNSIDFNEIKHMLKKKNENKNKQLYPFEHQVLPHQELLMSNFNEVNRISIMLKISPQEAKLINEKISINVSNQCSKLCHIGEKQLDNYIKKETSQIEKNSNIKNKQVHQVTSNLFYSQRSSKNVSTNKVN